MLLRLNPSPSQSSTAEIAFTQDRWSQCQRRTENPEVVILAFTFREPGLIEQVGSGGMADIDRPANRDFLVPRCAP